jgi:hypothetical protein
MVVNQEVGKVQIQAASDKLKVARKAVRWSVYQGVRGAPIRSRLEFENGSRKLAHRLPR